MDLDQTDSITKKQEDIPNSEDVSKKVFSLRSISDFYECLTCWALQLLIIFSPLLFLYMFINPSLRIFAIAYLLWMYYDRETPHKGDRGLKWLRKMHFWRYRKNYFPIKLIKTAELPPNTTYLFASFPHGIWVIGASTNFLSDVNRFNDLFPGLNPYIHVLHAAFNAPFAREILLFFGLRSVSSNSIQHVLNGPAGNVSIIIVGGYAEAMKSFPGTNRLVLKNRKGFVRMALKAGSPLVPVYTFGETNTYDQLSFNWYIKLQEKLYSAFRPGLAGGLVIAKGPSRLGYLFALLPHQTPLTTVVGSPIKIPKVENPSNELVDEFHGIFVQELTALFDKYKIQYDPRGENATLSIE